MKKTEAVKISEASSFEETSAVISKLAKPVSSSKKPDQWSITCSSTFNKTLMQFCEAQVISKAFGEKEDEARVKLLALCFDKFLSKFMTDKVRPANPTVVSADGDYSTIFILQDKYKINIDSPDDDGYTPENGRKLAIEALKDAGLTVAKATKFVESEVEVNIPTSFLSMQEMIDGHIGSGRKKIPPTPQSRSAGLKLQSFLIWKGTGESPEPLTAEEIGAITFKKMEWNLKPGMLDRVCNYVKTEDEIKSIFAVFTPVLGFRSVEMGIVSGSDATNEKLQKNFSAVFPS